MSCSFSNVWKSNGIIGLGLFLSLSFLVFNPSRVYHSSLRWVNSTSISCMLFAVHTSCSHFRFDLFKWAESEYCLWFFFLFSCDRLLMSTAHLFSSNLSIINPTYTNAFGKYRGMMKCDRFFIQSNDLSKLCIQLLSEENFFWYSALVKIQLNSGCYCFRDQWKRKSKRKTPVVE